MKLADTIQNEYGTVSADQVRKNIVHTKELEQIVIKYKEWLNNIFENEYNLNGYHDKICTSAHNRVLNIESYSQEDIISFSCLLADFEDQTKKNILGAEIGFKSSGIFLSSLIKYHYEKTKTDMPYTLLVDHLSKKLDGIGYDTKGAKIKVEGSVGDLFAYQFSEGEIHVSGSVGYQACLYMSGGAVTITGNAQGLFCQQMAGGTVHLGGSIFAPKNNPYESYSFFRMSGGEIHIKGDADYIGEVNGGRIYIDENAKRLWQIQGGEIHIKGDFDKRNVDFSSTMNGKIFLKDGEVIRA